MESIKQFILLFVFLLILIFSCEKIEKVDPVPQINFLDFQLEEGVDDTILNNPVTIGLLKFSFKDGDGANLNNVAKGDTLYSIHATPYIRENGLYYYSETDSSFYLTYDTDLEKLKIGKVGQNQILQGEITTKFFYYTKPADTIKYDFYMIDIDSNISNTATTNDIVF